MSRLTTAAAQLAEDVRTIYWRWVDLRRDKARRKYERSRPPQRTIQQTFEPTLYQPITGPDDPRIATVRGLHPADLPQIREALRDLARAIAEGDELAAYRYTTDDGYTTIYASTLGYWIITWPPNDRHRPTRHDAQNGA